MVQVALETPPGMPDITVLMDIVPVNIPALLRLDVLDFESLYANNVTNCLVHRQVTSRPSAELAVRDTWSVPIFHHHGHLYAKMSLPPTNFYTTAQLNKLHKQFAHPSATKL